MNFLAIMEKPNGWVSISEAETFEEAKTKLIEMVRNENVESGDTFRIVEGEVMGG